VADKHDLNRVFPWPPYYGHFNFFETVMRQHRCVSNVKKVDAHTYELTLSTGGKLRVFICECYSYGVAEYAETTAALGSFDAILINSNWCGYTPDAKRICRGDKVGLFKIRDFMAALNKRDFWSYLTDAEIQSFKEKGWL